MHTTVTARMTAYEMFANISLIMSDRLLASRFSGAFVAISVRTSTSTFSRSPVRIEKTLRKPFTASTRKRKPKPDTIVATSKGRAPKRIMSPLEVFF